MPYDIIRIWKNHAIAGVLLIEYPLALLSCAFKVRPETGIRKNARRAKTVKQPFCKTLCITLGLMLALSPALAIPSAKAGAEEAAYVATAKIHDSLPEMTFSLYPTGRSAQDDDGFPIWKLTVTSSAGVINDDLELSSAQEQWQYMKALNFVDINFDGYLDIEALRVSGANNMYSTYFLWDKDKFVPAKGCEKLSSYTLHPENKRIYNYQQSSALTGIGERYAWNGLTLVLEGYYDCDFTDTENVYVKVVLNDREGKAQTVFDGTFKGTWFADNFAAMEDAMHAIVYNTEYAGDCLTGTVETANNAKLNVRAKPGKSAKVLGKLPGGVLLWLKEYDDTWYQTVYNGKEAYVMKGYVKVYK
jgi:hypothetical protein